MHGSVRPAAISFVSNRRRCAPRPIATDFGAQSTAYWSSYSFKATETGDEIGREPKQIRTSVVQGLSYSLVVGERLSRRSARFTRWMDPESDTGEKSFACSTR